MPTIKIKPTAGTLHVSYNISTPTNTNAKTIDPKLPTILFLHPVYIASELFHGQFADRHLRQFNLVALDLRAHGETGGDCPLKKWNQEAAADDIAKFMDALKLPACHIFGLSMGTIIALQLAVSHPKKVLSLFLVSPLGLAEPEDVAAGREEIGEYWSEGLRTNDDAALSDAVHGALQLAFNNAQTNIAAAVTARAVPNAMKNWTKKNIDSYNVGTVKFFTDRKEHSRETLSKFKFPVHLAHCMDDVAYPLEFTEAFLAQLKDAGVNTTFSTIPDAPHFGCVTHPEMFVFSS
ncbi:alpha/beta-hydrolase [Cylindrobasidium torrendii FP15055 ss-10]|uniref:Alpha/beta-hydrolase n=1 Tax=Cylindrobasidium torrendii FP15055 ss-10 TaxID=1314674 RepID=A0A0D7BFB7_9AGAR|nr:alpha/beta-hydrolase [Cylindrobasidium torrendii FP15055 ss-10]